MPVQKIAGSRRPVRIRRLHRPLPSTLYTEDDDKWFEVPKEWEAAVIASLLRSLNGEEEVEEDYKGAPPSVRAAFTHSQQLAEAEQSKEQQKTIEEMVPLQYHEFLPSSTKRPQNDSLNIMNGTMQSILSRILLHSLGRYCPCPRRNRPNSTNGLTKNSVRGIYAHPNPQTQARSSL